MFSRFTRPGPHVPSVSFQTVTLGRGKHSSPARGVCVMELASMLAGEEFGDHPEVVCPVIASFLRAYNDSIDDRRRQDLYAYAAKVVDSRASNAVRLARADRLRAWAAELQQPRRDLPGVLRRVVGCRKPPADEVGMYAVTMIRRHNDETHAAVLALIDDLLRIDAQGLAGGVCGESAVGA